MSYFLRKNKKNNQTTILGNVSDAITLFQKKKYNECFSLCNVLYKTDQNNPTLLNLISLVYRAQGDLQKAKEFADKNIALNPSATAHYNLGLILYDLKEYINSKDMYERAIELDANYLKAYNNLGLTLFELNEFDKAIALYEKAIALDPNFKLFYMGLGKIYKKLKKIEKAKDIYEKVINLDTKYSDAYNKLGEIFALLNEDTKAKEMCEKAVSLDSHNSYAFNSLGNLLLKRNRLNEAKKMYEKAISIDTMNKSFTFNLSILLLLKKEYIKGFKLYRDRYSRNNEERCINLTCEDQLLNKNTNISGKVIFIYKEQGLGDVIQFIRFIPLLLKKRPEKIILYVSNPLNKLLKYNFPECEFIEKGVNPKFDYHFPIMEFGYLMGLKNSKIPFAESYLKVNKNDSNRFFKKNFNSTQRKKFGIVFKGNPNHFNDNNRSIKLNDFLKNIKELLKEYDIYSLQYEVTTDESNILKQNDIKEFNEINDFYDTALAIDNLDGVITVDTSVVHLSASLGKKTFVLLPYNVDWRWGIKGKNSIWYDTTYLYRQDEEYNWEKAFMELSNDVKEFNID